MIAYLEGTVRGVESDAVIVLAGGVGYRVFLCGAFPEVGETVSYEIYDHIREDRRDLFGFKTTTSRDLFLAMIAISGIGPKLGQKVLRHYPAETLLEILHQGDLARLTVIPGVGKKVAQKILLELKGVLVEEGGEAPIDGETLDALVSLGYLRRDVESILPTLTGKTTEAKIREALTLLSRV